MIVVDASLTLEIVLAIRRGVALMDRVKESGEGLAAPELIDLEILQTLRRLLRNGFVDEERVHAALLNLEALAIERFPHQPLAPRIWSLRDNLTAYDAAYFVLAECLETSLWTLDKKFTAVPGHEASIRVFL